MSFSFFQLVFSFNDVCVRVGALRGQKRGLNPLKLELSEDSVDAGNRTPGPPASNGISCQLSCGSQHLSVLNVLCAVWFICYTMDIGYWCYGGRGCQRQPSGVRYLWRLNSGFQAQALLSPSPVTGFCVACSSQSQPSLRISWGVGDGVGEVLISVSGERKVTTK